MNTSSEVIDTSSYPFLECVNVPIDFITVDYSDVKLD